ncbi:hypothetical protein LPJ63_001431 [Coemansia sp. RSA 2711]|nr:hypothetical protein LPJ63_001431 [Coemansia sp. RSA 2711]
MEQGNLWETVLREVSTSKAVAQKRLLVLGDAGSGKSSVVRQLLRAARGERAGGDGELDDLDVALSYAFMDVGDEDGEDVARVGVFQLASDGAADRELLRLVLDAQTFGGSAAVVVLDWARPWRFVKSLLRWLHVLAAAVDGVCGGAAWTPGRAAVDEGRERLERWLQEYSEDEARGGRADVVLPLGAGVLATNLGLPLVVVCTKADAMRALERERAFGEEDFDHVQQVLRAVCLRLGAALVYTSTHNPDSFDALYRYIAHRLLAAPRAFRANVVDRDAVFVPAGWDSAAKIAYLREPFSAAAAQDAWAADEARYRAVVERASRAADDPGRAEEGACAAADDPGAASLLLSFAAAVPAPRHHAEHSSSAAAAATAAADGMANEVAVEDDQAFFARLHAEQQEQLALEGGDEALDDVRARGSSSRQASSLLRSVHTAESSLSTAAALSDDDNDNDAPLDGSDSGSLGRSARAGPRPPQQQPPQQPPLPPPVDASLRRKATSNGGASAAADPGSGTPNEELTSFFQNLLGRKGGASSAGSTSKGSPQQASRPLAGSGASRPSAPKDIQADLERWKAQLKRQKD